jgi:hypothetical protein
MFIKKQKTKKNRTTTNPSYSIRLFSSLICLSVINKDSTAERVLCHINRLSLDINHTCSSNAIESLHRFIHLSHLVHLTVKLTFDNSTLLPTIRTLLRLVERTTCLHTIEFIYHHTSIIPSESDRHALYSLIPDHVEHCRISVKTIDDMKMIVKRLYRLSSVIFQHARHASMNYIEFYTWLEKTHEDFTYRKRIDQLGLWLGSKRKRLC